MYAIRSYYAQDELAALAVGEQPVDERGAHIADMQAAGGRRGEADDGGSHDGYSYNFV